MPFSRRKPLFSFYTFYHSIYILYILSLIHIYLFFACSGVFVMMFSLLLLVVIVFSDEEDGGSGGNLIYGGVSVSQEVLAHKPMLEKSAREYGIEEYLNVLLAIIQVESGRCV